MEVPGDPHAVLGQRQLADPGVQTGVVDRDARGRRQTQSQPPVLLENPPPPIFSVRYRLPYTWPRTLMDPEERSHRRMTGRETNRTGMAAQVDQTDRAGIGDQQPRIPVPPGADQALPPWPGPSPPARTPQAPARRFHHSERPVASPDQLGGRAHYLTEHARQILIRRDHRVQNGPQRLRSDPGP